MKTYQKHLQARAMMPICRAGPVVVEQHHREAQIVLGWSETAFFAKRNHELHIIGIFI
jgi:hypothetical protein